MGLQTLEESLGLPILIVDRNGDIGVALAKRLSESSTVVLVSKNTSLEDRNVINISYAKKIPKIPDNIYSHIFIVDDGEGLIVEALSSFLKKARQDRAVFCFCTILGRQKIQREIFEYSKSRILYLGDIFPQTDFFPKSYVNGFLTSAKNRGRIEVPQDGMAISYPIFFGDAISGILEASFGTSPEKIFYILPKHGVTLLTLAHTIQKKEPNIKIDFVQDETVRLNSLEDGKYIFNEKYPLAERIASLNTSGAVMKEEFEKRGKDGGTYSVQNLRLGLFAILFFLFLPLLTTLFFSYLGFLFLDLGKSSSQVPKQQILLAKSSFGLAAKFSKVLSFEAGVLRAGPVSALVASIEKEKMEVENAFGYYDAFDLFSQGKTNEAINKIKDYLVFSQTGRLKIVDDKVLNFISQTINVWPQVLAIDLAKTYLVIFPNDSVLRGSGGRIESFGLLTLENGKISDFKLYNPHDLDKNLKGHVEPPFPIRRYLKSADFHLMDASFDPDFRQVSRDASFFVELEIGKKVDGVVAFSNHATKKLSLDKNLKGKNLAKTLLSRDFVNLLETKDIIVSSNEEGIESVFSANNFSSALDFKNEEEKQINDFLSVFQTDIEGGSTVKGISEKVRIEEDGRISSTVSLELENSASSDSKKFLRIINPQDSHLKKIKIDGNERTFTNAITDPPIYEATNFKEPKSLEIEEIRLGGKKIFGFLVLVPKGKTQIIELEFEYFAKPLSESNFSYVLHFFKQPGAVPYPFKFSIDFPKTFKIYSEPSVSKIADRGFDLNFNFTK